jgi:hypothetical protein
MSKTLRAADITFEVVEAPPQLPPSIPIAGTVDLQGTEVYIFGQVVDVTQGADAVATWVEDKPRWRRFHNTHFGGFRVKFGTPGAIIPSGVVAITPIATPLVTTLIDPRLPVPVVRALITDAPTTCFRIAGPTIAASDVINVSRVAGTIQLKSAMISNRSSEWLEILDDSASVAPTAVIGLIPPGQLIEYPTTTPIRVRNPVAVVIAAVISAECYIIPTS